MTKSIKRIRIQLIENIPIYESGLRCLLEQTQDIEVLDHLQCEQGCKHACIVHNPDLLLIVIDYRQRNGLDCVQQILNHHPEISILVLSMVEDPYITSCLIDLGIQGVICSHTPPNILFRAIREIAAGRRYIDTDIARAVAQLNIKGDTSPFSILTIREFEITRLMLNGLNQNEIGEQLFISPHTVANHQSHILQKLHVNNRIELTKLAIRHGLTTA